MNNGHIQEKAEEVVLDEEQAGRDTDETEGKSEEGICNLVIGL